ncbi:hypothetical protein ACS0TY_033158 [Phlomoides rotata]
MTQYDQQHQAPVYPPPPTSYAAAPPPMGYPTKDGTHQGNAPVPVETTTKDGFLKGCLAGLCCCWCLDCCF